MSPYFHTLIAILQVATIALVATVAERVGKLCGEVARSNDRLDDLRRTFDGHLKAERDEIHERETRIREMDVQLTRMDVELKASGETRVSVDKAWKLARDVAAELSDLKAQGAELKAQLAESRAKEATDVPTKVVVVNLPGTPVPVAQVAGSDDRQGG